jgi:hypothetical protein
MANPLPITLLSFSGLRPSRATWTLNSGTNRAEELRRKFAFYEQYGVEEFYFLDPRQAHLLGWLGSGKGLRAISRMPGWVSPRLGIRFEVVEGAVNIFGPGGRRFLSFLETFAQLRQNQSDI